PGNRCLNPALFCTTIPIGMSVDRQELAKKLETVIIPAKPSGSAASSERTPYLLRLLSNGLQSILVSNESFLSLIPILQRRKSDGADGSAPKRSSAVATTPLVIEMEGLDKRYCARHLYAGAEVKLLKEGSIIHVVHLDRAIGYLPSNDHRVANTQVGTGG